MAFYGVLKVGLIIIVGLVDYIRYEPDYIPAMHEKGNDSSDV